MVTIGSTKVGRFFIGATTTSTISIGSLYTGTEAEKVTKIWEAVSSCFGSGLWRASKPWKGKDKWKY